MLQVGAPRMECSISDIVVLRRIISANMTVSTGFKYLCPSTTFSYEDDMLEANSLITTPIPLPSQSRVRNNQQSH